MSNKMLIDATHPEETRVVVLRDGRVEEFDYESAARKLLRGNIYLAKVTRVEPSLQAAFVDYGGNRHGFLAFNEIHPDYYQIPMADRQALLEEEAAAEAAEEAAADAHAERMARRRNRHGSQDSRSRDGAPGTGDQPALTDFEEPYREQAEAYPPDDAGEDSGREHEPVTLAQDAHDADDVISEDLPEPEVVGEYEPSLGGEDADPGDLEGEAFEGTAEDSPSDLLSDAPAAIGLVENEAVEVVTAPSAEPEMLEQTGAEDALEELPSRPRRRPRSYKIQEVIKRRQVILVQVVKEERGNKGAALTTYLSLAGRYTVLMPNTARGGGISRKITNPQDRKRLKAIAADLDVPEGMGLIIRTAGAARTQQEIKRDYEYLLRLWESVRDLTLQSTAPSLVYEEGNLIKRSIRDLYNKDVEEVVVAGDAAHEEARDFMRMLMPSHAKNVIRHSSADPLFNKYGIERQLNAMFSPFVTLKSGGYLVINQTEALVAIDVNSGKSTREFSIEETAYNTNLEAADEIARQLKLRDLAGLIVIDFIDMEEKRNNRSVERRLKDALRFDRARIQLGRISHFGLMEMSRQRLRTGVLEGSTSQCPHCQGTGIIRSTESIALAVLRGVEDSLMGGQPTSIIATTTAQVALYILNNKRRFITDLEAHHGISITVQASDKLQGANFTVEKTHLRVETAQPRRTDRAAVNMDWGFDGDEDQVDAGGEELHASGETIRFVGEPDEEDTDDAPSRQREGRDDGGRGRRRRRRRGRRGGERNGRSDERGEGRVSGAPHGTNDAGEEMDGEEYTAHSAADGDHPTDVMTLDDEAADEARGQEGTGDTGNGSERGGRRRRRGRRGGRRGRGRDREQFATGTEGAEQDGAGNGSYPLQPHVTEDYIDDFAGPADAKSSSDQEQESVERIKASEPSVAAEPMARELPVPGVKPQRRRSPAPIATEPKLERVVVTPDQAAADTAPAAEQPVRRGWWQRRS